MLRNYDFLVNGSRTIYLVNVNLEEKKVGLIYFFAVGESKEFFDEYNIFVCRLDVRPLVGGEFFDSEFTDFDLIEERER